MINNSTTKNRKRFTFGESEKGKDEEKGKRKKDGRKRMGEKGWEKKNGRKRKEKKREGENEEKGRNDSPFTSLPLFPSTSFDFLPLNLKALIKLLWFFFFQQG